MMIYSVVIIYVNCKRKLKNLLIMNEFFIVELARIDIEQKEIANLCDVTEQTIIRWKKGSPIPSDKLRVLHENGFNIHYIITGERDPNLSEEAKTENLEVRLRRLSRKRYSFVMTLIEEFEREAEEAEQKKAKEEAHIQAAQDYIKATSKINRQK